MSKKNNIKIKNKCQAPRGGWDGTTIYVRQKVNIFIIDSFYKPKGMNRMVKEYKQGFW